MPTPVVAFFHSRGVVALPGYSVFILPFAGSFSNTNWSTRTQDSAKLGGGYLQSGGNQNDEIVWNVWLDAGTYKIALIYVKNTNAGIFSVQLDTVEKGTVDSYAASASSNNYDETVTATVTAGLKAVKLKMATKNASSSAYYGFIQSIALIRTGA